MALLEGQTNKAATMFAEATEIATAIGDKRHILFALAGLGRVAYREERWEEAGTHARESLRLAQDLGDERQDPIVGDRENRVSRVDERRRAARVESSVVGDETRA
jgi:hypothetical protein